MRKYLHWKTYLILFAMIIVGVALYHFDKLAKEMAIEEKRRVIILVAGLEAVATSPTAAHASHTDITFASKVITDNTTIPLIITDNQDNIIDHTNMDSVKLAKNPEYLNRQLERFKQLNQ